MKNYKSAGETVTVTAGGTITSGSVVKKGALVGVAQNSAVSGQPYVLAIEGIFSALAKETGTAWTQGDLLYWDNSNSRFTKTANGNTVAGFAAADAGSGAATGDVLLVPCTEYAQSAVVAALTVGTLSGTANGAMESVGATNGSDVSGAISNNFKECFTQINAIISALQTAGVMATS